MSIAIWEHGVAPRREYLLLPKLQRQDRMLKLDFLFSFTNPITMQLIGKTPFGDRTTYIVGEGQFAGPRLRGKILPGGGDWFIRGEGGLARMDVRKTFQTDDGALLHVTYIGLYKFSERVTAKLARGEDAEFGDTLFLAQAQFETGDLRYAWLNETLAMAEARETAAGVEYQLYQVISESWLADSRGPP